MMLDHSFVLDAVFSPSFALFLDGRKPSPLKIRRHNLYGSKQDPLSLASLLFYFRVSQEVRGCGLLTHLYPTQLHLQHPPPLAPLAFSSTPELQFALRSTVLLVR